MLVLRSDLMADRVRFTYRNVEYILIVGVLFGVSGFLLGRSRFVCFRLVLLGFGILVILISSHNITYKALILCLNFLKYSS